MPNWDVFAIHCSASEYGTHSWIHKIHREQNGWKDTGYQAIILNGYLTRDDHERGRRSDVFDGTIEVGRPFNLNPVAEWPEQGAHIKGWNTHSFGVCLIGNGNYSIRQFFALKLLFEDFTKWANPNPRVIGHYEADSKKTCPLMNMDALRAYLAEDVYIGKSGLDLIAEYLDIMKV